MNSFYSHPVFQSYAAASVVLVVGLYFLAGFTGYTRGERKTVLNEEDTKVYEGAHLVEIEHGDVLRVKRAHLNLVENALPFFAIGLLYSLTDPSIVMARILFFGFVGIRFLHAVIYVRARHQPGRAMAFAMGGFINLLMAAQVLRAAL